MDLSGVWIRYTLLHRFLVTFSGFPVPFGVYMIHILYNR